MTVPFASLKVAVRAEQQYTKVRDMALTLAKALGSKISRTKMGNDYDRAMDNKPLSEAATALLSVIEVAPTFDIYLSTKEGSLPQILKKGVAGSDVLLDSVVKIGKSAKSGNPALVAFKLKHMGYFCVHTLDFMKSAAPRIVIASSQYGATDLVIQSLDNFKDDYALYGGLA